MYLYSLQPPPNPNRTDANADAGRKVFEREGCAGCHTPPHYTNNKLLPVRGFQVPNEHLSKYDILNVPLDTDPRLTLQTRRGTGYYKVPSNASAARAIAPALPGSCMRSSTTTSCAAVWYRSAFEHNRSVATLEDWFDERRLRDDYVPTRFAGYGVKTRAVKGHEFGLKLADAEKKSLIAFLKSL